MAPRHGNVVDAQVGLVAAAEFEGVFGDVRFYEVDYARGVLFLVEGLEDEEVAGGFVVGDEVESGAAGLDHEWVRFFADFTLEGLPVEGGEVAGLFGGLFDLEPGAETAVMDEADGAVAGAATKQWVFSVGGGGPAEAALGHLIFSSGFPHLVDFFLGEDALDFFVILEIIVAFLINLNRVFVLDLFHCKFDSTNFENIALHDFIFLKGLAWQRIAYYFNIVLL